MLSILDLDFDILGLTETRIIKEQNPTYDTSITGYKEYFTPTESTKGGTSLYINKNIESKERTDLEKNLYIPKKLESTFVELIIKGKKNIIIGYYYTLFENTMEKLSFENKELYLLGDYNIDLLKTDNDDNIDEYYNIISSNFLVPHITLPTRITSTSRTLIDNIFSNNLNFVHVVSGNLTVSISDHLSKDNIKIINKQKLFKREKNFEKVSLLAEVININWKSVLEIEKGNPNLTFENYNKKMKEVINTYLPLKKLSKKELKIQAKPWITNGIRSSIKRRDKLLRKFIKTKDEVLKDELYSAYIVSLTRQVKSYIFKNILLKTVMTSEKH